MQKVLMIGASSTVAQAAARLYALQGKELFLIARNQEKLAGLQAELGAAIVGISCYDFCEFGLARTLLESAWRSQNGFDLVIIAQGYLGDQLKSEENLGEAQHIIAVNYQSVVAQLIVLAPLFEAQGSGQIAAITSVAGERGRPRNYTYGSAKKALGIYLQGLRSRLYPSISVTDIRLGPVISPMTASHEKNFSFTSSEKAADSLVRAIARKRKSAYIPGYWFFVMSIVRSLPESIFQRLRFLSDR